MESESAAGSIFYSLGFLIEEADGWLSGKAGAAGPRARAPAQSDAPFDALDEEEFSDAAPDARELIATLGAAAGSWTLARLLRPADISWPRVILAGAAGTLLAELVDSFERRQRAASTADDAAPGDLVARYVAGIAMAVAYAAVLYPRIPGPPVLRGLAFGMLEAGTAATGGIIASLRQVAPRLTFPLATFATPGGAGASPAAHLAYGLGLGIVYRNGN